LACLYPRKIGILDSVADKRLVAVIGVYFVEHLAEPRAKLAAASDAPVAAA